MGQHIQRQDAVATVGQYVQGALAQSMGQRGVCNQKDMRAHIVWVGLVQSGEDIMNVQALRRTLPHNQPPMF